MYFQERINRKPINQTHIKSTIILAVVLLLSACATPARDSEPVKAPISAKDKLPKKKTLNKVKLAKSLGVLKPKQEIGFHQVTFNDCSIPREFRRGSGCNTQYLSVINFRMRCRDSEGTVEQQVSNYELEPLISNNVKWAVGKLKGTTNTNNQGYGRAIIRSWTPIQKKQFRLTANGHVMAVTASLVRQFVLPRYWCH